MLDSLTSIRIDMLRLTNLEATVESNYREIHCMDLLYDSQKQENTKELKNWFIFEELLL